jgi:O-antigen/teichoic acid export membrane protein
MKLRSLLNRWTGSDMLRDVLKLASGTIGGRLIVLMAMPLVTRLYSPDDFALLAVYLGAVNIGTAIACLRLDIAIPVAKDDDDAAHLLVLSLLIAFSFAALLMAAILMMPQVATDVLGQPRLQPWLWLIPLGIVAAANYSALQYWATRMRRFSNIAITRVTQATVSVLTMLGLGLAGFVPLGLLLGNMLNTGTGSLRLGREAVASRDKTLRNVSWPGIRAAFRSYRRFPIYSTPEALANIAGMQVPIMIVAAHAGAEAGYLLLAQQIMAIPMALLGTSIGQVYVSRAPEQLREGNLGEFTLNMLQRLIQVGVGPIIFGALIAPFIFPVIFGAGWGRSGQVMIWMLSWTVLQFLSSPISMVLHVANRQKTASFLQVIGFIVRIMAVSFMPIVLGWSHISSFIVGSSAFYCLYLVVAMRCAGLSIISDFYRMSKYFCYVIPWGAAAAFAHLTQLSFAG